MVDKINRELKYEYPKFLTRLINDLEKYEYKGKPLITIPNVFDKVPFNRHHGTTFKDFEIFDSQSIQNIFGKSNNKDDSILILNFWATYLTTINRRILRTYYDSDKKPSTSTFEETVYFFKCLKELCLKDVEKIEKYIDEDLSKLFLIEVKNILSEDLSPFNDWGKLIVHFGKIESCLVKFVKESGHQSLTCNF